jgi:hypothetical protein
MTFSATTFKLISGGMKPSLCLTLSAADKDGGAHVDAVLTPAYERLMESGDLGNFVDDCGNQTPITGHHFVALRQMGHELFASQQLIALAAGNSSPTAV